MNYTALAASIQGHILDHRVSGGECLDRVTLLGKRHLGARGLAEFVALCYGERNHEASVTG